MEHVTGCFLSLEFRSHRYRIDPKRLTISIQELVSYPMSELRDSDIGQGEYV